MYIFKKDMCLQYLFIVALCTVDTMESVPVLSALLSPAYSGNTSVGNGTSTEKLLSRRRGLIPNVRRRGDINSQIFQRCQVNRMWRELLENRKTSTEHNLKTDKSILKGFVPNVEHSNSAQLENENGDLGATRIEGASSLHRRRRRRWDYDENYDWENGGKDYVIPGEEPKKETKFEKFAKSWQKHALKVIFLFSFVCMICCCCLAICKKFCSKVYETVCWHLKDYRDICLNRDPTWRKARKFADDYGIELNYDQYKKIKKTYEDGFQQQGHNEFKDLSGR